ncbi:MAG: TadE/TadG family type IV pilus assembly protein [bacterium]
MICKKKLIYKRGAAAVEFAIILPILISLVLGICEFGFLLYNQQVITNASREGARAGIVSRPPTARLPDPNIEGVVDDYIKGRLVTFGGADPNNLKTTVSRAGVNVGDDLTVTVTYDYRFFVIPEFIPVFNPYQITARTVMKYE